MFLSSQTITATTTRACRLHLNRSPCPSASSASSRSLTNPSHVACVLQAQFRSATTLSLTPHTNCPVHVAVFRGSNNHGAARHLSGASESDVATLLSEADNLAGRIIDYGFLEPAEQQQSLALAAEFVAKVQRSEITESDLELARQYLYLFYVNVFAHPPFDCTETVTALVKLLRLDKMTTVVGVHTPSLVGGTGVDAEEVSPDQMRALVIQLCDAGETEEALELFQTALGNGLDLGPQTRERLMHELCASLTLQNFRKAMQLCDSSVSEDVRRYFRQSGFFESERILQDVAEDTGMQYVEAWVPSKDGNLQCLPVWKTDCAKIDSFQQVTTEQFSFKKGRGLPGRVWATRKSETIHTNDPNFMRTEIAQAANLSTGFGAPVVGENDKIKAVVSLFGSNEEHASEEVTHRVSERIRDLPMWVDPVHPKD